MADKINSENALFPEWIMEALIALAPPEKITVSEWADRHRVLLSETSNEPGKWDTNRTPYLRFLMDLFNDPEVEDITFLKPTQVGGTEGTNNIIGYIIAQNPAPTLVVYPTLELAEYTSNNRIKPMINACEQLKEKFIENKSKVLELHFDEMQLFFAGANSVASLATRPVKNVIFDETDKYPRFTGKEASPIKLGSERQRTFLDRKRIKLSTPTTEDGEINKSWEDADSQYEFFLHCPHCGHGQVLIFPQIKFNNSLETKNVEEISKTAYYECTECKGQIKDFHKPNMLKTGVWKPVKAGGKKKVALRLNSLYSPWLKFSDIVYEFLTSKNRPETLLNFVNSWLAEPWKDINSNLDVEIVKEHQTDFEEGEVPNEAIILTAGVDCQKGYFYWTIRAWGLKMTSWNVAHGMAVSWDEIDIIMNRVYKSANGEHYQVNLAAIDSGNDTDNVYDFVAEHSDYAIPIKGASNALTSRYKISNIEKLNSKANGLKLYLVDTGQFKDAIASRLNTPKGERSWMVYKDCDHEYMEQISSEQKVLERKGQNEKWVWKPKSTSRANHYLDCEVYAALSAEIMGVRYFTEADLRVPVEETQMYERAQPQSNNFVNVDANWLQANRNFLNK